MSDEYSKFHKVTMSYGEAEKYIMAGWTLEVINRVTLKGINKEIEECRLVWNKDDNPIDPTP